MDYEIPLDAIQVTQREFDNYLADINYYRENFWDCLVYKQKGTNALIGYYDKESGKWFLDDRRRRIEIRAAEVEISEAKDV